MARHRPVSFHRKRLCDHISDAGFGLRANLISSLLSPVLIRDLFKAMSGHRSAAVMLQHEKHLLGTMFGWNSCIVPISLRRRQQ